MGQVVLQYDRLIHSEDSQVRQMASIHIRPTGKIYLYDEDGVQLEKVGKESIVDEN